MALDIQEKLSVVAGMTSTIVLLVLATVYAGSMPFGLGAIFSNTIVSTIVWILVLIGSVFGIWNIIKALIR